MTLREIDFAVAKINRRLHNKTVLRAALQGVKLEPWPDDVSFVDAAKNPDQTKLADQAMRDAIERKKAEMTQSVRR